MGELGLFPNGDLLICSKRHVEHQKQRFSRSSEKTLNPLVMSPVAQVFQDEQLNAAVNGISLEIG